MRRWGRNLVLFALCLVAGIARAQDAPIPPMFPSGAPDPALLERLPKDARIDSFGNVWVTRGSGSPHVLWVTRRDSPGYVVSRITPDGYLRLQRLGTPLSPLFDQFMVGRRVLVYTQSGGLPAVVACPSTHLRRGADLPVPEATVDDLWVDVGAQTAREAADMGIALLDPVVLSGSSESVGASAAVGVAAGIRANIALLSRSLDAGVGTRTIAFVAGGSEGGRGSRRLLATLARPDSVYVFESIVAQPSDSLVRMGTSRGWEWHMGPGDTTLVSRTAWAQRVGRPLPAAALTSADARVWANAGIPTTFVGVPAVYVGSPAELSAPAAGREDLRAESRSAWQVAEMWNRNELHRSTFRSVLRPLLLAYGVSEQEDDVATAITRVLPDGAAEHAILDERGNLILRLGEGPPDRMFIAHMDEIGYRVTAVDPDGRGRVKRIGGFYDWLYEGETVRVGRGSGGFAAVVPPREGYRTGPRPVVNRPLADEVRPAPAASSRFDVSDVRIDPGLQVNGNLAIDDDITVFHEIARLGTHRISARAIDDRFGCAALVMAAKELWPERKSLPSTVWMVWSVEEEIGLRGATWLADSLLKAGMLPRRVHAVDTFVSSDSPLEDPRYGDARLGQGAVVRAVDTSHEAPIEAVRATLALAKREDIPLQYGVTSGGNDGVPFAERGSINVPLAWPLRYAHTAVEVADLRDLESLARLITALSREKVSDDPNRP